jgi:hypothetical protein
MPPLPVGRIVRCSIDGGPGGIDGPPPGSAGTEKVFAEVRVPHSDVAEAGSSDGKIVFLCQ